MNQVQLAFPMSQLPLWGALGIIILGAVFWTLRRLERRRAARLHSFVDAELAPRLLLGYDARVRKPLNWLILSGVLFGLIAIVQPRWGQAWLENVRASRDILVLLDTSESMNAQNPLPSRLERAKQKIESLVQRCPGDRFGVIAFSGDAVLQCPLTADHAYFLSVLKAVDTDTMTEEGTDIAEALREAVEVFRQDAEETGQRDKYSRAALLLSDGEQVQGDALTAAGELAEEATLYVVGIGNPEGAEVTFPSWMLQYTRVPDARKPHLSKLDEKTLSQIALKTADGVYVRSTPDNADIEHLFQEMETLRGRAVSSETRLHLVNRYRWPLTAAVVCFAAEGLWLVIMPLLRRWRERRGAPAGAAEERLYA